MLLGWKSDGKKHSSQIIEQIHTKGSYPAFQTESVAVGCNYATFSSDILGCCSTTSTSLEQQGETADLMNKVKLPAPWPMLGMAIIISFGCKDDASASAAEAEDAGPDAGNEIVDAGIDAGQATQDAGDDSGEDTDTGKLASAGMPCWREGAFPKTHPNFGLPDCEENLNCIGTLDGAWCTTSCATTGTTSEAFPFQGWCCGELSNPCVPQRYWLPSSMSFNCIPRSAGLAQPCSSVTEWTGDNERCAPVCNGEEQIHKTQCAQYDEGGFCTYQCDPVNGDADCVLEPAFEGGCCGEAMGGFWCLVAEHCQ